MANKRRPWAAYKALMLGRLIGLNKCPSLRPVRVGETWWRLLCKVCVGGDGSICQRGLRYVATLWRVGSRYCGGYSRGAAPVEAEHPGGGLGVSTQLCA